MLEIVRYTNSMRAIWDDVVTRSLNGTFLHTRNFYDHNALNDEDDCSFLYYKKNKAIAVIPCILYEKEGKLILNSHLRATYGGFIVTDSVGVEEAVEIVEKLINEAKNLSVEEIIIRNPFRIFNLKICDETDYAMWHHGFNIKSRELETVIKLTDSNEIQSSYEPSTLRSVKKSKQYISVRQNNEFEEYWNILSTNLLKKHGASPTHSYKDIQILINKIGPQRIRLFAGYKGSQMAGGVVVFVSNSICLHAQYIASDDAFQEFRPLNAIIDEIICWGSENNYTFLNLGTSNTNSGKSMNSGLFRFKEGFGGRNILRETMHLLI